MHQHDVGLDVHSKQSVFAIADAAGKWVAEGEVPTTPAGLTAWCEQHALAAQTPVALETGGDDGSGRGCRTCRAGGRGRSAGGGAAAYP